MVKNVEGLIREDEKMERKEREKVLVVSRGHGGTGTLEPVSGTAHELMVGRSRFTSSLEVPLDCGEDCGVRH